MASRALQALRQRVTVDWPKMADADARAYLVRFARAGHDQTMREQTMRAGVVPEWDAYANTPANTNLDTVKLPGPIVYRYRYHKEIVLAAIDALREASPKVSGAYKDSHFLWVNDEQVPLDTELKRTDDIFIANTVPYARRLEVGKKDNGEPFIVQKDPDIYKRVMNTILIPKYGKVAEFRLGYVTLPDAWKIRGRLGPDYALASGKRRKRRQNVGELVRAPAIFIGLLK
jgi:hypothetical protein